MYPVREAPRPLLPLALFSLLLFVVAACAERPEPAEAVPPLAEAEEAVVADEPWTLADVVLEDDRFDLLATALDSAGLTETLYGEGPFTVFAPTNEAFAALPVGTVNELLRPEHRERLRALLLLHIADGSVKAAGADTVPALPPLAGSDLLIRAEGDRVTVGAAAVIDPDIEADNGVVDAIDAVLLPDE